MQMIDAPLPKTDAEKLLAVALLKVIRACIDLHMPIGEILNALEHVRHTVTEIKLEVDRED